MYTLFMGQTTLFIDGENFIHKIDEVVKSAHGKQHHIDLSQLNFHNLFEQTLREFGINKKLFYAAKLKMHPETKEKSIKLIQQQRKLRNALIGQGFEFIVSGNVRGQKVQIDGKSRVIFKEKGVDVKIAVDLVSMAADKLVKNAILCSSDSDLQPAIKEVQRRGVEIIYLGFEFQPNKGIMFTANRTILFRNSEVLEACKSID